MMHSRQQTVILVALSCLCLCIATATGQEPEVPDAGSTGGGGFNGGGVGGGGVGNGGKSGIWPMVNVDKQDNKSRVDVHVPIFFDMTNDRSDGQGKSKLDLSVLSGLVTVNRDRAPPGKTSGPLTVTVFGIPVYNGKSAAIDRPARDSGNEPIAVRSGNQKPIAASLHDTVGNMGTDASHSLYNAVRQANERAMNSLADIFGRLSSMARQAGEPKANTNGAPASESLNLFKSSRFEPQDFEPKQFAAPAATSQPSAAAAVASNSLANQ